ncbi:MAG: diaminopimelate decarboxylase [Pseudomonadota bacterium]
MFHYQHNLLYAEDVALTDLAAEYGTPCYVYSRAILENRWNSYATAWGEQPHLICYAVKANSNLAVLSILAKLGSGFDIVSGGELERVLRAGGDPKKIIFSGVGKSTDELRRALEVDILCFNVESVSELERLNQIAIEMNTIAPVSLRVNPDVDARTHPYISTGLKENKFGVDINHALDIYLRAADLPHLAVTGVDCHIGSQLTELAPFLDATDRVLDLVDALESKDIPIRHIDLGGGLGVQYQDETVISPADYVKTLKQKLAGRAHTIMLEPGRSIVADAGILLTRVEYLKHHTAKHFAVIDAAMNDLIRPALYGAWQDVLPVQPRHEVPPEVYDVVGPICESGDFLAKERELALQEGDLLAIASAGAYSFSMSSNYNTRPRAAEIIVDGDKTHLARRRETIDDLLTLEQGL